MRFLIALLAVLGMTFMSPAVIPAAASADSGYALTLDQQPSGQLDVNIDVNRGGGGGDWWTNPIWIGIGAVGLLLLVVLVAMAARGGGTTVVKG